MIRRVVARSFNEFLNKLSEVVSPVRWKCKYGDEYKISSTIFYAVNKTCLF